MKRYHTNLSLKVQLIRILTADGFNLFLELVVLFLHVLQKRVMSMYHMLLGVVIAIITSKQKVKIDVYFSCRNFRSLAISLKFTPVIQVKMCQIARDRKLRREK